MAYSKSQRKATEKWEAKSYDQIKFTAPKGFNDRLKQAAELAGKSNLVWAYKNEAPITGRWCWKIYLGWKLQRTMLTDYQAMIATRLWIGRK